MLLGDNNYFVPFARGAFYDLPAILSHLLTVLGMCPPIIVNYADIPKTLNGITDVHACC